MRTLLCAFVVTLGSLTPSVVAQGQSEPARLVGFLLDSLIALARERQASTLNPSDGRLYLVAAGKMAQFTDSKDLQVPAAAVGLRVFFENCFTSDNRIEREALVARTSDVVRAHVESALLAPKTAGAPQVLRLSVKERTVLVTNLNKALTALEASRAPEHAIEPETNAMREIVLFLTRGDLEALNDSR